MEETKKVFTNRVIGIATYFGGPAAAGYLVKKNYEAFNQDDKGKAAFFIGIISTLLIFAGIFAIPDHIIDKVPNLLIPAVYTLIIYLIVEKIQGPLIEEHKESGGEFYSGWKAAGIGAVFMAILLAFIAGTAYVAGDLSKPAYDSETYKKELAKFTENETEALEVYNELSTSEPEYLIKEFSKGIPLWEENKEIVKKLNAIENLPPQLLGMNVKLMKYCDLRIEYSRILIQALNESPDKYLPEIERVSNEISDILNELKE